MFNLAILSGCGSGELREGDSVRLAIHESVLSVDFLLNDLTHRSVGFLHSTGKDENVCLILQYFININIF